MADNRKEKCVCTDAEHACHGKKTVREEEQRRKLINRLKRIEGQVRGI